MEMIVEIQVTKLLTYKLLTERHRPYIFRMLIHVTIQLLQNNSSVMKAEDKRQIPLKSNTNIEIISVFAEIIDKFATAKARKLCL